ncbi:30S ribosomal protein S18 [bacterium]|nr:30S ribosomal protein S18 [bacterium]
MQCLFCQRNIKEIDFRDTKTLENFISALGKIRPRKKTGLCAYHQRRLAQAIKRARFLALLPYTKE